MGNTIVLPETDARLNKLIDLYSLTHDELSQFMKIFSKLDRTQTGLLPIKDMFEAIETSRNAYTDSLLELLDIDYADGEINFSEFLDVVMTFCMFEKQEILKFILHMYDEEKAESFSTGDMQQLMNILHNLEEGEVVKGNVKDSWNRLTFADDNMVDYSELNDIHSRFPKLFQPAFMLQNQMMIHFMGEIWWSNKKNLLKCKQEEKDAQFRKIERQRLARERAQKAKKIKRAMGLLMYFSCPCLRFLYDPSRQEEIIDANVKAEREKLAAEARRKADLAAKNPETKAWKEFDVKVNPEKGGTAEYVVERHMKTERQREVRAETRADRKDRRKRDKNLQHKFTTATSLARNDA